MTESFEKICVVFYGNMAFMVNFDMPSRTSTAVLMSASEYKVLNQNRLLVRDIKTIVFLYKIFCDMFINRLEKRNFAENGSFTTLEIKILKVAESVV